MKVIENCQVERGGLISNENTAEYLFSDDSSAADTISYVQPPNPYNFIDFCRLHLSEAFSRSELTIFTTQWIFDVVAAGSCQLTPLISYVLPPAELPSAVPEIERPKSNLSLSESPSILPHRCHETKHEYVPGCSLDGIAHVDELDPGVEEQDLLEFMPNKGGCKVVVTKKL